MLGVVVVVWSLVAASAATCKVDLSADLPRARATLAHRKVLSEAEAGAATAIPVIISYDSTNPFKRLLRFAGGPESSGFLFLDAQGEPHVLMMDGERRFSVLAPNRYPRIEVWDESKRLLSVVKGRWHWEQSPPPRREVSQLSLGAFMDEFEAPVRDMLEKGILVEADLREGVLQLAVDAHGSPLVVLEAPAEESPPRVFVFRRGSAPAWDESLVKRLGRDEALEVGPNRRRLYLGRDLCSGRAAAAWAPPRRDPRALVDRIKDPNWRGLIERHPGVIDLLALHPLAPDVKRLADATVVNGVLGDAMIRVLLVPRASLRNGSAGAIPFDESSGRWLRPEALSPDQIIALDDGRRLAATPSRLDFRWLARIGAFERLKRGITGKH